MHSHSIDRLAHDHVFLSAAHRRNEARLWLVVAITAVMMIAEIVAGSWFNSMALLADGWHMATHAGALAISAFAYWYARRHVRDRRFTFGTGKVGELAAYTSALILGAVAVFIGWESFVRFQAPLTIAFDQAVLVAGIGLGVNLVCAVLLWSPQGLDHDVHHGHSHHGHDHSHQRSHKPIAAKSGAKGQDRNMHAAFIHVVADALSRLRMEEVRRGEPRQLYEAVATVLKGEFTGPLTKSMLSMCQRFRLRDGHLHRIVKGKLVPVEPSPERRRQIILAAHELGHFDTRSTFHSIEASLWWPTLYRECQALVASCHPCQQCNVHATRPRPSLPQRDLSRD